jgi:hypothetical protein
VQVKQKGCSKNKNSFAEFQERYGQGIFPYAYRHLGYNNLAVDSVAETFHRFLIAVRGVHHLRIGVPICMALPIIGLSTSRVTACERLSKM